MSTLEKYKRYIERGELEFVLETAAADRMLSDEEYAELHVERMKLFRGRKAGGYKDAAAMRDRDYAKEQRP